MQFVGTTIAERRLHPTTFLDTRAPTTPIVTGQLGQEDVVMEDAHPNFEATLAEALAIATTETHVATAEGPTVEYQSDQPVIVTGQLGHDDELQDAAATQRMTELI